MALGGLYGWRTVTVQTPTKKSPRGGELSETVFSLELLARRLAKVSHLSDDDRRLLIHPNQESRFYSAGTVLSAAGSLSNWPKVVVSGWAGRESISPSGRRQLLSIFLPGDLIGNREEQRALDLVEVVAISNVRVVSAEELFRAINADPIRYAGIVNGLSALRFLEEHRFLDHMVRLGAQPALQRVAGFLLELFERCRAIGFVSGGSFVMPLTQEMLGQALGLSVVHINRVIGHLKNDRLIDLNQGIFKIPDPARLALVAGLEPIDTINPSPVCMSNQGLAPPRPCKPEPLPPVAPDQFN